MHTADIVVTILLAAMLAVSAAVDQLRYGPVLTAMARAGVPESWLPALGTLKVAGAIGLLVGIAAPAVGIAAAVGVALFFVGAILTHLRARWGYLAPTPFLVLAVGALALRVASL